MDAGRAVALIIVAVLSTSVLSIPIISPNYIGVIRTSAHSSVTTIVTTARRVVTGLEGLGTGASYVVGDRKTSAQDVALITRRMFVVDALI